MVKSLTGLSTRQAVAVAAIAGAVAIGIKMLMPSQGGFEITYSEADGSYYIRGIDGDLIKIAGNQ